MRNPPNPFDLIETQIELLENLNRRLEELDTWRERFPAHAADIVAIHNDGIKLGVQVRAMDDFSDNVEEVNRHYHAFVHHYENLWLLIQKSPALATPDLQTVFTVASPAAPQSTPSSAADRARNPAP